MFGMQNSRQIAFPTDLPEGGIVSTYDHYSDVQHAVDVLAQSDFPVRTVSIIGNGVRSVERVVGKLGYGKIAVSGASTGAYMGLFFGILLFVFDPSNSNLLGLFVAAIVIGAGFGMLLSTILYAINRRRRQYQSVTQAIAERYDLIVPNELVQQAREVLIEHAREHHSTHTEN